MATVFDYLKWRGDLSFAQDPLTPVDGLISCVLSFFPFVGQAAERPNEPIALRDAAADFLSLDDYESRVRAKNDAMMLRAAAETARFGGCKMVLYRDQFAPEEETQFAAMTFLLPDDPEKIRPLLDRDVADPWYTGDFGKTWDDLVEGCTQIMEEFG